MALSVEQQGQGHALREVLCGRVAPAAPELVQPEGPEGAMRCFACGHRCLIRPGKEGVCRVRFNVAGTLKVPFGYVAALACDPIEKKPFYHVLPGSDILTFGMLGCDFHCGYCQNWVTSQALRDDQAGASVTEVTPQQIVEVAKRHRAPAVASSYNEPLITSEWAMAVFTEAQKAGLKCCYISNGNATEQVLRYLRPKVQAYKVDLKSFDDRHYRELGGVLENVKSTIRMLKEMEFWVEIVTLLVPGFNDNPEELKRMAGFLAQIDPLIPWHLTAFHSDYKMDQVRDTQEDDLIKAGEIGRAAGLAYVYLGNRPGRLGEWENTRCHHCGTTLIRRRGFVVLENRLPGNGECPGCGRTVPGIWR